MSQQRKDDLAAKKKKKKKSAITTIHCKNLKLYSIRRNFDAVPCFRKRDMINSYSCFLSAGSVLVAPDVNFFTLSLASATNEASGLCLAAGSFKARQM